MNEDKADGEHLSSSFFVTFVTLVWKLEKWPRRCPRTEGPGERDSTNSSRPVRAELNQSGDDHEKRSKPRDALAGLGKFVGEIPPPSARAVAWRNFSPSGAEEIAQKIVGGFCLGKT